MFLLVMLCFLDGESNSPLILHRYKKISRKYVFFRIFSYRKVLKYRKVFFRILTISFFVTLHSKDWNMHRLLADVRYLSSARCCARCHRESVKGQKTKAKSWRLRVPDGKGANAERCNLNFSLFTFHSWLVLPSLSLRYVFALPSLFRVGD